MENRTASAMPGRPRTKADPTTQGEIVRRTAMPDNEGSVIHTHAGVFFESKGPKVRGASICAFGGIVAGPSEELPAAIKGGAISCGDKNYNVPNHGFSKATPGQWLVEISIDGVDPQTDDDETLILPGIITASGTPAWNLKAYTGTESYTSNTNPATPTSTGTIVLPIGILTVNGGGASLAPTGCGSFVVEQCAGILSYRRVSE